MYEFLFVRHCTIFELFDVENIVNLVNLFTQAHLVTFKTIQKLFYSIRLPW